MHARIPAPYAELHSDDAKKLGVVPGDYVEVAFDGGSVRVQVVINDEQTKGMVVLPRHLTTAAIPYAPVEGDLKKASAPAAVTT